VQFRVGTPGNCGRRIREHKTVANSGGVHLVSLRLSSVVTVSLAATAILGGRVKTGHFVDVQNRPFPTGVETV
jgi:hypothetical protein